MMSSQEMPTHFGNPAAPRARGAGKTEQSFSLRGRVIAGLVFATFLLAGVGGWGATAKLSGAVVSAGTVLVDTHVKAVQHPDGGVVRSIDVREGEHVAAGQILLQLEDVSIRAERAIVQAQLAELLARQAHKYADATGAETMMISAKDRARFANAQEIFDAEARLYVSHLRNRQSQSSQLDQQISQLSEEIAGLEFQRRAMGEELALLREEHARATALREKGLIEIQRLYTLDREVARMHGLQGELEANIARARSRIAEVTLQKLAIHEIARTEAQRELRVIDAQIAETEERLTVIENRLARTVIRAPVAGNVLDLSVTTLGGVISPAERLLTVVPSDALLVIEFRVATRDIDQISLGQPVKLRFSAFNHRTTPEIDGRISRISAAASRDVQTGESYYAGQVEVVGNLSALGDRGLVPGMPVEVFVQTQQQVALAYLVRPFTDQMARAFREE